MTSLGDRDNRDLATPDVVGVLDAHCHIDLYPDPVAVAAAANALDICTIAVTNAPSVFHFTKRISLTCSNMVPAVGLHPELVKSHGGELEMMWPLLLTERFVGEIGLDYVTNDPAERSMQRRVFEAIVQRCAESGGKVLTLHSRRAAQDVLAVLGQRFPGTSILHWFSGTPKQVAKAVDAGCFFSVNSAMVSSSHGLSLISGMPRDRVLTESDGPFVKVGVRPATPADTSLALVGLAQVWRVEPTEVAAIIQANFRRIHPEKVWAKKS